MNLKPIDYTILSELIKNSRISDRQLARKIGSSQPTVTRRRAGLEELGLLDYTAIPNFEKLGFGILAFTFARWKHDKFPDERVQDAMQFLSEHPNIIFVSTGRGFDSDRVCISIHETYRDYYKLMQEFRQQWEKYMENLDSFLVSIGADDILRQITFKHFAEHLRRKRAKSDKQ